MSKLICYFIQSTLSTRSISIAVFAKYFTLLQTKPNAASRYVEYVDLKDIENIRSDDYILRMPFYLRAKANVHLLLSKKPNPTENDDAYELGMWSEFHDSEK